MILQISLVTTEKVVTWGQVWNMWSWIFPLNTNGPRRILEYHHGESHCHNVSHMLLLWSRHRRYWLTLSGGVEFPQQSPVTLYKTHITLQSSCCCTARLSWLCMTVIWALCTPTLGSCAAPALHSDKTIYILAGGFICFNSGRPVMSLYLLRNKTCCSR